MKISPDSMDQRHGEGSDDDFSAYDEIQDEIDAQTTPEGKDAVILKHFGSFRVGAMIDLDPRPEVEK